MSTRLGTDPASIASSARPGPRSWRRLRLALAAALVAMLALGAVRIGPLLVDGDECAAVTSIEQQASFQDPTLLRAAWRLPVAALYGEKGYEFQANASFCGPASVANVLRSLGIATSQQQVIDGNAPAEPLQLRVLDRWDNALPGVELQVLRQAGTAALPTLATSEAALPPLRTDGSGIAQLVMPALAQAGVLELRFATVPAGGAETRSADSPTATATVRLDADVKPGPAAVLDLRLEAPAADADPDAMPTPEARVRDVAGNAVPDVDLVLFRDGAPEPAASARADANGKASWALPDIDPRRGARLRVAVRDDPSIGGELRLPPQAKPSIPAPAARRRPGAVQSP